MRRMLSCGLVVAMAAMGMPAGVYAAGKSPAARQDQQTGTVKGEAKDSKGRKLAGATVRVRNASTGAIAAEVLSDGAGGFVAAGLAPGSYVVEIVNAAGQVIGLSPAIAVVAGTTATITVTATAVGAVAAAAAAGGGLSVLGLGTAATVGLLAAVATGAIMGVVAVNNNASPSGQ